MAQSQLDLSSGSYTSRLPVKSLTKRSGSLSTDRTPRPYSHPARPWLARSECRLCDVCSACHRIVDIYGDHRDQPSRIWTHCRGYLQCRRPPEDMNEL